MPLLESPDASNKQLSNETERSMKMSIQDELSRQQCRCRRLPLRVITKISCQGGLQSTIRPRFAPADPPNHAAMAPNNSAKNANIAPVDNTLLVV